MSNQIMTLKSVGVVSSVEDRVNEALENFYLALYSQTTEYQGLVRPLSYLCQQYGSSESELTQELTQELTMYLKMLFDDADVRIQSESEGARFSLRANISVIQDGQKYVVGHLIKTHNLSVESVFDYVNDSVVYTRTR